MLNEKSSLEKRDDRIDSVKYCLMVLVIAGHIFSQKPFISTHGCSVVWKWIYIFHMPLFVFLSGYFSHKKSLKNYMRSCLNLFEPLLIFHLLMCGSQYLLTGMITWKDLLTPWWVLWYLLSLICWRTLAQFIPEKYLKKFKTVFVLTFGISILSGLLPFGRFLSIQRTLAFSSFFFLGYCMKGKNLFLPTKYKPLCFFFLTLTTFIPLFFPVILGDLNQAQQYGSIYDMYRRAFVFLLSIPMSVSFINICPNTPQISLQGRMTLFYYVFHAIIIYFFMFLVIRLNLPTSFLAASIYTFVVTVGLGVISNVPGVKFFTNPLSFLVVRCR